MSNYPPSLDPAIIDRCWVAENGELGVRAGDVESFLRACERDEVSLLGWELWLIDHWDAGEGIAEAPGLWTGLIPSNPGPSGVWQGVGDVDAIREQIGELAWQLEVPEHLHRCIRYNFTLDG